MVNMVMIVFTKNGFESHDCKGPNGIGAYEVHINTDHIIVGWLNGGVFKVATASKGEVNVMTPEELFVSKHCRTADSYRALLDKARPARKYILLEAQMVELIPVGR
jgi:hypothetical protein